MHPRLKNIIKKKLSEDLSSVSIIDYNGSIWFIDAKSKYWYLELYKKTKTLWWRLDFFEDFFLLFGMEQREFVPIITEWVEEVLNGKVASTKKGDYSTTVGMEEALNSKVASTQGSSPCPPHLVEEILKSEVVSSCNGVSSRLGEVEEVLNDEIGSTNPSDFPFDRQVEEALHDGVVSTTEPVSTRRQKLRQETQVEKILNAEGVSADSQIFVQEAFVQELFKNMIGKASPDCNSDYLRVEDVITYHNSLMPE
jgi:hypothetical protein